MWPGEVVEALPFIEFGLKIDVVAYPDVLTDRDAIKADYGKPYVNRVRVGGAKLTIACCSRVSPSA